MATDTATEKATDSLPPDALLTTRQVMARLSVSRATVDRWRARGRLQSIGRRKLRRYRWADVLAALGYTIGAEPGQATIALQPQ